MAFLPWVARSLDSEALVLLLKPKMLSLILWSASSLLQLRMLRLFLVLRLPRGILIFE